MKQAGTLSSAHVGVHSNMLQVVEQNPRAQMRARCSMYGKACTRRPLATVSPRGGALGGSPQAPRRADSLPCPQWLGLGLPSTVSVPASRADEPRRCSHRCHSSSRHAFRVRRLTPRAPGPSRKPRPTGFLCTSLLIPPSHARLPGPAPSLSVVTSVLCHPRKSSDCK